MKSKALTSLSLFAALALIVLCPVQAAPTAAQQAQIDTLKKTYPLTTCPVSGDALDSADMGGKPIDYLYTQTNPDGTKTQRLVRFCCGDCVTKFKKDPEKYLKIVDAAQTKAPAPATAPVTGK